MTYLPDKQIAKILGLGVKTAFDWAKQGKVRYKWVDVRGKRAMYINLEDCYRWGTRPRILIFASTKERNDHIMELFMKGYTHDQNALIHGVTSKYIRQIVGDNLNLNDEEILSSPDYVLENLSAWKKKRASRLLSERKKRDDND